MTSEKKKIITAKIVPACKNISKANSSTDKLGKMSCKITKCPEDEIGTNSVIACMIEKNITDMYSM